MWRKSIVPGGLAVIAAALMLAGCQSSSSSGSSSGSSSSTPAASSEPTTTQVNQALTAFTNGVNAALAGTSVVTPPLAPTGAPDNGNAINFRVAETVKALSGSIRPDTTTCNANFTICTFTNKAGTVLVTVTSNDNFVTATVTFAFTNYSDAATGYVVNGTVTVAEKCTAANCSSYNSTQTGTLAFTGPAAFSITWNTTVSSNNGTLSCSGTVTVSSTTYTISANCSTVS